MGKYVSRVPIILQEDQANRLSGLTGRKVPAFLLYW
jgi:hypothetical protein